MGTFFGGIDFSLPSHCLPPHFFTFLVNMPTNSPRITTTIITIAYTLDTILTKYHPLIPWLAMRQNNRQSMRLGDIIGFEQVHGPAFRDQETQVYGHITGISHFVQGFVIVMASLDPQAQVFKAFGSRIYVAIPRQWISLSFRRSVLYRLAYRSLPIPRFLHLLDRSHGVYQLKRLNNDIEGSRTVPQV